MIFNLMYELKHNTGRFISAPYVYFFLLEIWLQFINYLKWSVYAGCLQQQGIVPWMIMCIIFEYVVQFILSNVPFNSCGFVLILLFYYYCTVLILQHFTEYLYRWSLLVLFGNCLETTAVVYTVKNLIWRLAGLWRRDCGFWRSDCGCEVAS